MTKTDEPEAQRASRRRAKDQLRIPLSMRVTPEIRERLLTQARIHGRSVTQEAELRLAMALNDEDRLYSTLSRVYGRQVAGLLILIGEALKDFGPIMGWLTAGNSEGAESWLDLPYPFEQAVRAINLALEAVRPEGEWLAHPPMNATYLHPNAGRIDLTQLTRDMGRAALTTYLNVVADPEAPATPKVKEVAAELRELLGPAAERIARYVERQKDKEPTPPAGDPPDC